MENIKVTELLMLLVTQFGNHKIINASQEICDYIFYVFLFLSVYRNLNIWRHNWSFYYSSQIGYVFSFIHLSFCMCHEGKQMCDRAFFEFFFRDWVQEIF